MVARAVLLVFAAVVLYSPAGTWYIVFYGVYVVLFALFGWVDRRAWASELESKREWLRRRNPASPDVDVLVRKWLQGIVESFWILKLGIFAVVTIMLLW